MIKGPLWNPADWTKAEEKARLKRKFDKPAAQSSTPPFPRVDDEVVDPWSMIEDEGKIPCTKVPKTHNQSRIHPNAVTPIPGWTFAPPYNNSFLRTRPELADALQHVNCSYLTAQTRPREKGGSAKTFEGYGVNYDAPTLGELKQHLQSLMALIKEINISTSAAEINAETR